jgi:RND family efflux transporter MFP subunit
MGVEHFDLLRAGLRNPDLPRLGDDPYEVGRRGSGDVLGRGRRPSRDAPHGGERPVDREHPPEAGVRGGDADLAGGGLAPEAPVVLTRPVEARPLAATVPIRGELEAWQDVELRARVSAFVQERPVDVGSTVRRGDLLVRLSAPDQVARRAEAEADLRSAEARLSRLEAAAKAEGVVAPVEVETLRAEVDARRSEVDALAALERELTVRAPFDGVVTDRGADVGALVGPGSGPPLVRVTAVDPLRLVVAVPEAFAESATVGREIAFAAPGAEGAKGIVSRVSALVEDATRTVRVELDVPNADGKLRPGGYADVRWPAGGDGDHLFVPSTAVLRTTEGIFVLAVEDGHVERIAVRPGLTVGKEVEVSGDLDAELPIVVRASEDLVPGAVVVAKADRP